MTTFCRLLCNQIFVSTHAVERIVSGILIKRTSDGIVSRIFRMEQYLHYIGGTVGAAVITGAAVSAVFYLKWRPKYLLPQIDLNEQSMELSQEPHQLAVRISKLCSSATLVERVYEDVRTLQNILYSGLRLSNDGPCLGWRDDENSPYNWLSYNQVIVRVTHFGAGLVNNGLKPGTSTFVGIYAQNCPEWIIAEQGCYNYSMVTVPLYDTLGSEACSFIINQAEIRIVICDKEAKVEALLKEAGKTPSLKTIIYVLPISEKTEQLAKDICVQLLSFSDVEELGQKSKPDPVPPKASDLATVCYTSGTTGDPKGVMLSHGNIMANVSAVMIQLGEHSPRTHDVMLGFLPLAHMLERCCETCVYMVGGCVGFYRGDIKTLNKDMQALRPTIIPSVPRLLNKIYDRVQAGASNSKIKSWLLSRALESKMRDLQQRILTENLWDKLVFKPAKEAMGGRLRLMVVGSAPMSSNILTFIRCALGCVVVEGYGQTECVAPCTLTMVGDNTTDHVGPPIPCCQIKLVDVPDMEYYSSNDQGEVCVKGPSVFQGYFKDPDKTLEAIDKDGWLHTGDIGVWLPNGTLKVIDRKKHIFKLSQGEYIAPEKIENIYLRCKFISQVFVHGDSLKSCVVAVVIPDLQFVINWCNKRELIGSWHELLANKELKKAILNDMIGEGKKAGLKSFEQVKDIHLHSELLSLENGLLTPTMKTKRPECRKVFKLQIDTMYSALA